MNILEQIIEHKKSEVNLSKKNISVDELQNTEFYHRKTYSLKKTLKEKSGIIAEFKRKSPSKGNINIDAHPKDVVYDYQKYGASAISILTDNEFFGGSAEDLKLVRNKINIPILRKDFMIESYQFFEAKAMGTDIILLIAACLSPDQVKEYTDLAHQLKMEVLLEIHSEEELKHYHPAIDFVGINNRNLKNFEVDLQHSINLKNALPKTALSIAESGIYTTADLLTLKEQKFDGFLMGEYFMKTSKPGETFKNLVTQLQF